MQRERERAEGSVPCFRYYLHQSDEQRGGGRQGGMWHRHFLDICRVWLSREATPREPSGFEVCEAPGLESQGDFICYLISNFSFVQDLNDVEPVCIGFSPAKVLSVSPPCGWGKGLSPAARPRQPLLQLLGFSWAVRGFGAFVPYRWSQTMVAPSTSPGCAWFPSCAVRALRGMQAAKIPQGFVPSGRKGRDRLPLPTAKEATEKLGCPQLEQPRGLSYLGPSSGAAVTGVWCRDTLPLHQDCSGGVVLEGTTAPRDPAHAHVGLSPSFAASVMLQASLESIVPTLARRAGSKAAVTRHACCSQDCCSACFDTMMPRSTTGSSIMRHDPFSLG